MKTIKYRWKLLPKEIVVFIHIKNINVSLFVMHLTLLFYIVKKSSNTSVLQRERGDLSKYEFTSYYYRIGHMQNELKWKLNELEGNRSNLLTNAMRTS